MINTLYDLTPDDTEWPAALNLASQLFVYNRHKDATHFWDRAFLESEFRLKLPSQKFLDGLCAQGMTVYKATQNHAACQEWVDKHTTTWEPPGNPVHYAIYFSVFCAMIQQPGQDGTPC